MRKKAIVLMLSLVMILTFAIAAAEPASGTDIPEETNVPTEVNIGSGIAEPKETTPSEKILESEDYSIDIPVVTTEQLMDKIESKGNDIIAILQRVGRILCVVGFVVCCILAIFSIINPDGKRTLTGAFIGMLVSGIAYAAITCGPEIVQYIAAWVQA